MSSNNTFKQLLQYTRDDIIRHLPCLTNNNDDNTTTSYIVDVNTSSSTTTTTINPLEVFIPIGVLQSDRVIVASLGYIAPNKDISLLFKFIEHYIFKYESEYTFYIKLNDDNCSNPLNQDLTDDDILYIKNTLCSDDIISYAQSYRNNKGILLFISNDPEDNVIYNIDRLKLLDLSQNNDIYSYYRSLSSLSTAKITLIYPAQVWHIRKYLYSPTIAINETIDMYNNVVAPYMSSSSSLKWIDSLFDGTKEQDTTTIFPHQDITNITYDNNDTTTTTPIDYSIETDDNTTAFVLCKDPKWPQDHYLRVRSMALKRIEILSSLDKLSKSTTMDDNSSTLATTTTDNTVVDNTVVDTTATTDNTVVVDTTATTTRIESLKQELSLYTPSNSDLSQIYYLLIVKRSSILSMRSLTINDLPFLYYLRNTIHTYMYHNYGLSHHQLLLHVHYLPTYYRFHIHINASTCAHSTTLRSHNLDNIIYNLQYINPMYYQSYMIPIYVSQDNDLGRRIYKYYIDNKNKDNNNSICNKL